MIQLITKADLPDYTKFSANTADLLINPAIRDAHTFDVLPHLSEVEQANLVGYRALTADERPQHPAHKLYTEAVRPLLCYETYRRLLLDHGIHVTPRGVEIIAGEGTPISGQQRTEMRADAAAKCSHYQAVLASALRAYRGTTTSTTCGTDRNRRPSSGGLRTRAI
jgi:hypothetical protein